MRGGARTTPILATALSLGLGACGASSSGSPDRDTPAAAPEASGEDDPRQAALARLRHWENVRRDHADFASVTPWSERAGADPFALLPQPQGWLGLLRGEGQLVRLDDEGETLARRDTLVNATGWALVDDTLWVVGPREGRLWRHRLAEDPRAAPLEEQRVRVEGVASLRSIAVGPGGRLALGDPYDHRVLLVDPPAQGATQVQPRWSADCGGPLALHWSSTHLVALCMLEHAVSIWSLDEDGWPQGEPRRIEHDGPMWSLDVAPLPDEPQALRLVIGGVEDHPLDRSDGDFGYVDSFVFVVDLPAQGEPRRRAAINVSEHGALTPKWVSLAVEDDGSTTVHTIGYGGDALVELGFSPSFGPPRVKSRALLPGVTQVVLPQGERSGMAASPLLDAWIRFDDTSMVVHAEPDDRATELRVGEALAFTGLMAPAGTSEGKHSRFTCETCHFEGGTDGRVHFTGREQVHASTKTLRGLFENRPHFTRALDRTMAAMVNNEFDVASRGTEGDPWFSLRVEDVPWLGRLGVTEPLDAEALRRSLMAFVMAFAHEPNPARGTGDQAQVRAGLELFATHCEGCHQARLVTDDPHSRVESAQWLALLEEDASIVWATDERMKTGIEPYVHPEGARVSSLRRLHLKRPYFTNGSAPDLAAVLEGFSPSTEQHLRGDGEAPLSEDDRAALLAFVRQL